MNTKKATDRIRDFVDAFSPPEPQSQLWLHPDVLDAMLDADPSGQGISTISLSSARRKFVLHWNENIPRDSFMALVDGRIYWKKLEDYEGADF